MKSPRWIQVIGAEMMSRSIQNSILAILTIGLLTVTNPIQAHEFDLQTEVSSQIDQDLKQNAEQIRVTLNEALILPSSDRINFFKNYNIPTLSPIKGWRGVLDEVTRTEKGEVATVRVFAQFDGVRDSYYVVERYLVNKQGVRLISVTPCSTKQPRLLFSN